MIKIKNVESESSREIQELATEANAKIIDGSVYSLEDYKGEESKSSISFLKMFIAAFPNLENRNILYFYGSDRTQKTTVALSIGYEILQRYYNENNRIKIKYIRMVDLLDIYFNKYNRRDTTPEERSENEKSFKDIMSADLLIVDEAFDRVKAYIGKNETQNVLNFFDSFKHHIIFISNVEIDKIDPIFGGNAIKSRLREGFGLPFNDVIQVNNDIKKFSLWNIYDKSKLKEDPKDQVVKIRKGSSK